jgi:signal transduction histidine kinase
MDRHSKNVTAPERSGNILNNYERAVAPDCDRWGRALTYAEMRAAIEIAFSERTAAHFPRRTLGLYGEQERRPLFPRFVPPQFGAVPADLPLISTEAAWAEGKTRGVGGAVFYAEAAFDRRAWETEKRRESLKVMVGSAAQVALGLYDAETAELLQGSPSYLNALEGAHGVSRDQILGRKWSELAFGAASDAAGGLFESVAETGEAGNLSEIRIRARRDGRESVWNFSLTPVHFEAAGERRGGKAECILLSAADVTEQVQARERMAQLDFLKDQFFSLASHELRTPLVPLMGYSEALIRLASQSPGGGENRERDRRLVQMASRFRGQLKRLERLTDDLLDMAQLQSGKFSLRPGAVNLAQVVESAVEEARVAAPSREIRFETEEGNRPMIVRGDEARLIQVMNKLLNNAIEHAPQSDRIDVRLVRAEHNGGLSHARIEVRDYGPGIPPGNLGTIFNRFYQISVDGRQPRGGLGLGLYLAKDVVEQHGGAITVRSKPGKGSVFVIRLPLLKESKGV